MSNLWPWLAIAGIGALHGLNPATGWMLAAAWGLRSRDRMQALRALAPIAVGHIASVAIVAVAVALGLSMNRIVLQMLAGGLLAVGAAYHFFNRKNERTRTPAGHAGHAGHAGLALWSFMMSNVHGAGLMLAPALIPLCTGSGSGHAIAAAGPAMLTLALAAVGIHTAAMLAVTGLIASGVCRGFDLGARLLHAHEPSSERSVK